MHWFNQWKKYVGWDNWDSSHFGDPTCHPGKIDNSALLTGRWSGKLSIMVCNADVNIIFVSFFFLTENTKELKEHLTEDIDFTLVPEPAWLILVQLYGLSPGEEAISRKVMTTFHCHHLSHFFSLINSYLGGRPWHAHKLLEG